MDLAVDIALWTIAAALALTVALRARPALAASARKGGAEFLRLVPGMLIGVMGSGYIAAALPQDLVGHWLGQSSGFIGILVATIAGALTPGGPMIGFALSAAALKGGAGGPQVIAYSTAWALFAFPRLFMFELPILPAQMVWLRVVASLPIPFLAAAAAVVAGQP